MGWLKWNTKRTLPGKGQSGTEQIFQRGIGREGIVYQERVHSLSLPSTPNHAYNVLGGVLQGKGPTGHHEEMGRCAECPGIHHGRGCIA